jgi:hypothetical protein
MTTSRFWRVYSDSLDAPEPTTLEREAAERANGGGLDRPALCVLAADAMHATRAARAYALDCERTPSAADPRETSATPFTDLAGNLVPVIALDRTDRASTPEERRMVAAREAWFRSLHEARTKKRNAQAQAQPEASPIEATPPAPKGWDMIEAYPTNA